VSFVYDRSCYRNEIAQGSTAVIDSPAGADTPALCRGMLFQNYPNPFNPATTIEFEVPGLTQSGGDGATGITGLVPVTVAVYDLRGALVKTLVSGTMAPGRHRVVWNGTNEAGARVATGVYFCRMQARELAQTKKMVLIR
jgi:hypothetical protein